MEEHKGEIPISSLVDCYNQYSLAILNLLQSFVDQSVYAPSHLLTDGNAVTSTIAAENTKNRVARSRELYSVSVCVRQMM